MSEEDAIPVEGEVISADVVAGVAKPKGPCSAVLLMRPGTLLAISACDGVIISSGDAVLLMLVYYRSQGLGADIILLIIF